MTPPETWIISEQQLIDACLAKLPDGIPREHRAWAKGALQKLIPSCLAASLLTEEGESLRFSVATAPVMGGAFELQAGFRDAIPLTPSALAKLAATSEPGTSFLLAYVPMNGQPYVSGIGVPVFNIRLTAGLARAISPDLLPPLLLVSCLGPLSVLVEGFGCDLGFTHRGVLQPDSDNEFLRDLPTLTPVVTEDERDLADIAIAQEGKIELRHSVFVNLVETLARGCWFAGHGGVVAIDRAATKTRDWHVMSAKWLAPPLTVLESFFAAAKKSVAAIKASKDGRIDARTKLEADMAYAQRDEFVALGVRLSMHDGAVLIDRDGNIIAFGAQLTGNRRGKLGFVPHRNGSDPALDLTMRGTRHSSAYRWVSRTPGRVCVVISQDRSITVFEHAKDAGVRHAPFRPLLFT